MDFQVGDKVKLRRYPREGYGKVVAINGAWVTVKWWYGEEGTCHRSELQKST